MLCSPSYTPREGSQAPPQWTPQPRDSGVPPATHPWLASHHHDQHHSVEATGRPHLAHGGPDGGAAGGPAWPHSCPHRDGGPRGPHIHSAIRGSPAGGPSPASGGSAPRSHPPVALPRVGRGPWGHGGAAGGGRGPAGRGGVTGGVDNGSPHQRPSAQAAPAAGKAPRGVILKLGGSAGSYRWKTGSWELQGRREKSLRVSTGPQI